MRTALARALSVDDVNQLGRDTGQSERLRTITPHRLFLSVMAALAWTSAARISHRLGQIGLTSCALIACSQHAADIPARPVT
jgi:hypothetical protein